MSCIGMKMDCFVNQSTTTRIAVKPLEDGRSCLMKSIEIESQGWTGMGSCQSSL